LTVEFTATAGYDEYVWDFDDGVTDNTTGYKVSHTFTGAATYSVSLTVTDGGLTDSDNLSIYVYPALDYGKVLVTSSDGGESGQEAIIKAIYPSADVTFNGSMTFSQSVTYAKENGIGIVCRPTTGLSDSRIASDGDEAEAWGIIPIHAHGSNSYVELTDPSYVGSIWAMRHLTGSYGDGVEFTVDVANESNATGTMAGWVCKFMDSYVVTIANLRTLFRENASNGGVFNKTNGYGTVDFNAVQSKL